jgi:hypothetical protein
MILELGFEEKLSKMCEEQAREIIIYGEIKKKKERNKKKTKKEKKK